MPVERVIGVDLGGTKILAGLVERDGTIVRSLEVPTPRGPAAVVLEAVDRLVETLVADGPVAIGFGVPMNLDRRTGRAVRATNLPLVDVDFRQASHARFGLPVGVENDGNAATLAEWRLGAARGLTDVVMLTLGTGVGGGFVLEGNLYRGWAELGHLVVVADGHPCQGTCHGFGHLEAVASGGAADRAAARLFGPGAGAPVLVEQARTGHLRALEELGRIGHLLGVAIGSLTNLFAPEVVLVGGGFGAAAGDLILEAARRAARREAISPADERVRIVPAALGEEAGLIGAALVGFEALDGAPVPR